MKAKRSFFILLGVALSFMMLTTSAMGLTVKNNDNVSAYINGAISLNSGQIYGDAFLNGALSSSVSGDNLMSGDIYLSPSASSSFVVPSQMLGSYINVPAATFPSTIPTFSANLSSIPAYSTQNYTTKNTTFNTSYTFNSITLSSKNLVIDTSAGDVIFVTNTLNMGTYCSIDVQGSNRFILVVNNSITNTVRTTSNVTKNNFYIVLKSGNFTQNYTAMTGNLFIPNGVLNMTGGGSVTGNVVCGGSGTMTFSSSAVNGVVYAPKANVVLQSGSSITGFVVGNSLSLNGSCRVTDGAASFVLPDTLFTYSGDQPIIAVSFNVTFDKNGGTTDANPTTKTAKYGCNIGSLPTEPTRTGYTFNGWNTAADGSGSAFDATTSVTGNTTVYAQWTINTYTITFDKNGGTTDASPTTKTATYGSNVGSLPTAPTKTGYTFAGWNSAADGSGSAFDATTSVTGNTTVYAQWTINTYTITFDKNGGTTDASPTTKTATYGSNVGSLPTASTKTGYTFAGWNTAADGTGDAFTASTAVTADVTVYAQWTINTYTVTFDNNGGDTAASPTTKTATYGGNVGSLPTEPTRTGYTFVGWNTASDGSGDAFTATTVVAADVTVYAQWTPITYTVTFDKNGGTTDASPTSKTATYGSNIGSLPTEPTKTGYTFAGWNTAADGTGDAFTASTAVTADVTVYAQWTINSYTVTFDKNGGTTDASPTTKTATYGGNVGSLPTEPTKTGYTFAGWNTADNGTGDAFTAATAVTTDITVYAQWTIDSYTVTFDKNGGTTDASPTNKTATYGGNVGSLPTEPTRTGYTFNGWNTEADGSGTTFDDTTSVTANTTVYAQWTAVVVTYTVTFDKNGGTIDASPTTKTATSGGNVGSLPTGPTRTGYAFDGWNTAADGSGSTFTASTAVTADITVYAQWVTGYTITFYKNGGDTEAVPNSITYKPGSQVGTLPTPPTRTCYTFRGWNTAADGSSGYLSVLTSVSNNMIVYAQWLPGEGTCTVTFNSNGGNTEANPRSISVMPSSHVSALPTNPAKTGYTFDGWNTAADGSGTSFLTSTLVTANITVYAQWKVNTYTVYFNNNGGNTSASPSSMTATYGGNVGSLPTPPSRTGYTFAGWNTRADGMGTVFNATTIVKSNITVYAQWTIIPGDNVWDGTVDTSWYNSSSTEFIITTAEQLAGLAQLTNNGNSFSGKTVKLGADIELNAVGSSTNEWTPIGGFCGTFDGQGHTVSGLYYNSLIYGNHIGLFSGVGSQTVVGTIKNLGLINSYIEGMDYVGGLVGYATQANIINCYTSGVRICGRNNVGGLAGYIKGNIENCYNTCPLLGCKVGGLVGQLEYGSVKNSYNTADVASYLVESIYRDQIFSMAGGIAGAIDNSNISNCYNTGDISGVNDSLSGICPSGLGITKCYYLNGSAPNNGNGTGMDASAFSSGEVTWNLQDGQSNLAWGQNALGGSNMPLLTAYNTNAKRVHQVLFYDGENLVKTAYVLNGGTVILPTLSKDNYNLTGWNTKADGTGTTITATTSITNSLPAYAQWTPVASVTYTVTFDNNGGVTEADPTSITVASGSNVGTLPAAPTWPWYTCTGWNTKADGSGLAFTSTTSVTTNLTVYAQWAIATYTVNFCRNYTAEDTTILATGTGTSWSPVGVWPTNPNRSGYSFSGWNTVRDGSGTTFTSAHTLTSNMTVYAQWTHIVTTYTVTFDKNGGTTDANPTTETATSGGNIGSLPTEPTRTGYTFAGWNTAADGSGSVFTASTAVTADITIYAQWTPISSITYTVTFDKNGGNTDASPTTMTAISGGNLGSLPTAPTQTGYTFTGWNTAADGSGSSFTSSTTVTADITVYAQWVVAGTYASGLNATYYDTLSMGDPIYKRMIDQVNWPNFNYGGSSPDPVIDSETFSIVFTGYICPPEDGEYTFYTYSDDGVRLTIGSTTILDRLEDIDLEFTEGTPISMTGGNYYPLELDYFENHFNSTLFLFYSKDGADLALVPASWYYSDTTWTKTYYNNVSGGGNGLTINYFNSDSPNFDSDTPVLTRQGKIFLEYLDGSPAGVVNNEHFSALIEGYIESRYTEDLTLQFVVDDGLRVYIDDALVIDEWHGNSSAVYPYTFAAESSHKYKIRIEYCEYTGSATCCMFWYSDGFNKEVVPLKYLYPVDYAE